jgi:hypothetical protein
MRTYETRNDLTKLQLAKLERDDPAAYLEYAAKKRKAAKDKEKRDRNDPKCNTGNYQCRGKKGVACIPKSKGCSTDLKNINPARRQYIETIVNGLKAEGAKPKTARIGRKLGAPIVELTPEQYGKAMEMNISQLKLMRGDATREQLRAIGVDVDGVGAKPKDPPELPQVKSEKSPRELANQYLSEVGMGQQPLGKEALRRSLQWLNEEANGLHKQLQEQKDRQSLGFVTQRLSESLRDSERNVKDKLDSIAAFDQMTKALEAKDPSLVPSVIGEHAAIPDRVKDWIKKEPAFDLRNFDSAKYSTIIGSPVTEMILRSKGEILSNIDGSPQKVVGINPPSKKYPLGSISMVAQDETNKRRIMNILDLYDRLRYSAERRSLPGEYQWPSTDEASF